MVKKQKVEKVEPAKPAEPLPIAARKEVKLAWKKITSSGTPPPPREYHSTAVVNDEIYIFSGRERDESTFEENPNVSLSVFWVFNTTRNEWRTIRTTPPSPRCSDFQLRCAAIGNKIWVNDSTVGMCYYDTTENKWTIPKNIGKGPGNLAGGYFTAIGNKIYSYDHEALFDYDTTTNTWSHPETHGDLPYDRHDAYLFEIQDNKLMMLINNPSYEKDRSFLFYYDLTTRTWFEPPVPTKKTLFPHAAGESVFKVGNYIFYVNSSWENKKMDSACVLDLITNTWSITSISGDDYMPVHESGHSGCFVNGYHYVWGCDKGNEMHKLELFDVPTKEQNEEFENTLSQHINALVQAIPPPPVIVEDKFESEAIVLDSSLTPCELDKLNIHYKISRQVPDLFLSTGLADPSSIISHNVPEDTILAKDAKAENGKTYTIMHKNFIEYLTIAWSNHFSVEISPDIIFYTVLCEIADTIKKAPEKYKSIFTSNDSGKTPIISVTSSAMAGGIDVEQLVQGIIKASPNNIGKLFDIKFSCTTPQSKLAMSAAFCDAMSPYYTYYSTMCGIPQIRLLGNKEDWVLLETSVKKWAEEVFKDPQEQLHNYVGRCADYIHKMHTNRTPEFWNDMFLINRCHSGHSDMVEGWITQMYRNGYAQGHRGNTSFIGNDFYNYESHVSTVKYKNVETSKDFELFAGLLYSTFTVDEKEGKHPFLHPQFAHLIREVNNEPLKWDSYEKYLDTLDNGDRNFLERLRDVMDTPVVLVSHKKREQKLELLAKLAEHWCDLAEKGDPKAVTTVDMWDSIWFDLRYTREAGESLNRAIAAITRLISLPHGPSKLERFEIESSSYGDDDEDEDEEGEEGEGNEEKDKKKKEKKPKASIWSQLPNSTSVKTLHFCNFGIDDFQYLAEFLLRPDCPLEEMYRCDFHTDRKGTSESDLAAITKLSNAFANTRAPLRSLDYSAHCTPLFKGICQLLARKDTPVRKFSPQSLREVDSVILTNTLHASSTPLEEFAAGDMLRFVLGEQHNFYNITKKEKEELGEEYVPPEITVTRLAEYIKNTPTLKTVTFNGKTKEVVSAIAQNQSIKTTSISFGWNTKNAKEIIPLFDALFSGPPHLEVVDCGMSFSDIEVARALAKGLEGGMVTKGITMVKGGLTSEGAILLAKALANNKTFEQFSLCKTAGLGHEFGKEITGFISSAPLKYLNLQRTGINVQDILPTLAKCTTLEIVELSENNFEVNDESAKLIATLIKNNPKIKQLELSANKSTMSEQSWELLIETVRENHSLTRCFIANHKVHFETMCEIAARNRKEQGIAERYI